MTTLAGSQRAEEVFRRGRSLVSGLTQPQLQKVKEAQVVTSLPERRAVRQRAAVDPTLIHVISTDTYITFRKAIVRLDADYE